MHCPVCQYDDSKVVDTRASGEGIRRRRVCLRCEHRFSTFERVELRLPLVVKKDGRRVPFERDKIVNGLRLACRKRPVTAAQIEQAATNVEQRAMAQGAELSSSEVGRLVLGELSTLDKVAFLRFASVYQDIDSPDEFLELLRPLLE